MKRLSQLFASTGQHGVALCLGLIAGTAVQVLQADLGYPSEYGAGMLLALILWVFAASEKIAKWQRSLFFLLSMAVAGYALTGARSVWHETGALAPVLEGRDVAVTGVVTGLPQRNAAGLRFRLQVESASLDGQPITVPQRWDVAWYGGVYPLGNEMVGLQRQAPELQAGERWQLTVRLRAPHGSLNPHGFDYELWLWEQGVQATGYVRAGPRDAPARRLEQTWLYPMELARQRVRDRILASVGERQQASLIAALVAGDQNAIDRADWDVFRSTGVAHLVSISGLHITMFAWAAAWSVGWLWRRSGRLCLALPAPSAALAGGVFLATAYAVFSGWGVPAQRTCTMLATVAILRLSGRHWPWPAVWALACACVVVVDPWALLQAGFWLSFVAVGVLFATGEPVNTGARRGIAERLRAAGREQWLITLALAPLSLLLFGQVSVVGLLANLLAIPWVTLVLTPLSMAGILVPLCWDAAAMAAAGMVEVLQQLAQWPLSTLMVAKPPLWLGVAGLLGAGLAVAPLSWRLRSLGLPLVVPVFLWQTPAPAIGQFSLLAADIGQGNAVLVQTASHALLYDAGPRYSLESDAGHRVLVPLLQALQVPLDRVVLSHRDTDHVGGAAAVLDMQPQAQLLSSIEPAHPLRALRQGQRCEAGQHWVWDGVDFDVLHPLASDYDRALTPNALSCVLRIHNGKETALLVGDIEAAQEARLVADSAALLKSTVLMVPHHGSKTSSTAAFLDATQPRFALVQAGYRNRFGHPVPSVLSRYRERNMEIVDSPHCGAMQWRSDQPAERRCMREEGRRYWHHRVP